MLQPTTDEAKKPNIQIAMILLKPSGSSKTKRDRESGLFFVIAGATSCGAQVATF
jgi:hypothetical protein